MPQTPQRTGSGKRITILGSYVYEDYAHQLDEMSETDRTQHVIADMEEVHPGLRQYLETVIVKILGQRSLAKGRVRGVLPWPARVVSRDSRA
jgi:hypothetical protein